MTHNNDTLSTLADIVKTVVPLVTLWLTLKGQKTGKRGHKKP